MRRRRRRRFQRLPVPTMTGRMQPFMWSCAFRRGLSGSHIGSVLNISATELTEPSAARVFLYCSFCVAVGMTCSKKRMSINHHLLILLSNSVFTRKVSTTGLHGWTFDASFTAASLLRMSSFSFVITFSRFAHGLRVPDKLSRPLKRTIYHSSNRKLCVLWFLPSESIVLTRGHMHTPTCENKQ